MPPAASSLAYHEHRELLAAAVDQAIIHHPQLGQLIGPNPFDLIQQNHANHAKFMDNVFFLGNTQLLVKTLPWVYRVYGARGVSMDYVPVELRAWRRAITEQIPDSAAAPLLAVYDWMLDHHNDIIEAANRPEESAAGPAQDGSVLAAFVESLVTGDSTWTDAVTRDYMAAPQDLERFYLEMLDPAMREIGRLWEQARITTAQEHMASSLVIRMMSKAFAKIESPTHPRKRCVVSASPNEHHQIGAWMISDLLEVRGWHTRFLGADTPSEALLATLDDFRPTVLALSVTMSFNLRNTAELIARIRQYAGAWTPRIMVGGRVFQDTPGLAASIGADGEARDAAGACLLAESWFEAGDELD